MFTQIARCIHQNEKGNRRDAQDHFQTGRAEEIVLVEYVSAQRKNDGDVRDQTATNVEAPREENFTEFSTSSQTNPIVNQGRKKQQY